MSKTKASETFLEEERKKRNRFKGTRLDIGHGFILPTYNLAQSYQSPCQDKKNNTNSWKREIKNK